MIAVIICFAVGVLHGAVLKWRHKEGTLQKLDLCLLPILFAFLLLIGFSVGNNPKVMDRLGSLTLQALLLAFSGMLGSLLLAPVAKRIVCTNGILDYSLFKNRRITFRPPPENLLPANSEYRGLITSSLLLFSFISGVFLGRFIPYFSLCTIRLVTMWVLYALMWIAGVSSGGDHSAIQMLKKTHPVILVLPLFVVIGTLVGTGAAAKLFLKISPSEGMGVGAGMGYYSLSCAMISSKVGTSLGVLALLSNLIREVATIGFAPFIFRIFGPFGLLAAGASTTCTSSLPSIMLCAGKRFIFIAVINGIALTLLVPALILMIL